MKRRVPSPYLLSLRNVASWDTRVPRSRDSDSFPPLGAMRRTLGELSLLASLSLVVGCAINLPFSNRLNYEQVSEAKHLSVARAGPIAIKWIPPDFPERIDVQGASGFVGGGSRTRIPTGVALAARITEALDSAVGLDRSSSKILTITVEQARSKFQYSAGFFNVTPSIDRAECLLQATFSFGGVEWKEQFSSSQRDPSIGGRSQTALLEKAWDDIALQVTKSVVDHLSVSSSR
jgi:hypothetical protein